MLNELNLQENFIPLHTAKVGSEALWSGVPPPG